MLRHKPPNYVLNMCSVDTGSTSSENRQLMRLASSEAAALTHWHIIDLSLLTQMLTLISPVSLFVVNINIGFKRRLLRAFRCTKCDLAGDNFQHQLMSHLSVRSSGFFKSAVTF
ncbi:hypothetical protein CHARACLAT_020099 [Characodon lateralis]|uniref:Uncharacterized protein n=1 Tax=Characodon lateralis TaxID=208331 RepID=A0ABU7EVS9_9TELE|nr:hypothetical protein [Characodon lateralis]